MSEEEKNVSENEIHEEDDRSFIEKASEKVEDTLDDVMGGVQDIVYGPKGSFTHDIPATMEDPNGIRHINKVQTRRNIRKRLFGKKGAIIFLVIMLIGIAIGLIVHYVG